MKLPLWTLCMPLLGAAADHRPTQRTLGHGALTPPLSCPLGRPRCVNGRVLASRGRRKRLQRLQNAEVAAVAALCALCLVLQRTTDQPGAPGAMVHSPRPCRVLLAVHGASMGVFWPLECTESGFSGFKASSSENEKFENFQHD